MTHRRWLLLGGVLVVSMLLALFLRDTIFDLVVVPIAYLLWVGATYYAAIPQAWLWVLLIAILVLVLLWNLIPEPARSRRKERRLRTPEGRVEEVAIELRRLGDGNYFKWQLANRLGHIARELNDGSAAETSQSREVEAYFDAGLKHSFVDFPTRHNWFGRQTPTTLDVDLHRVVDHLEAQMERSRGRRA